VLRETQFLVGGALLIAAGGVFLAALAWSGAGFLYFGAWLGGLLAIGFGAFFVHVARAEGQERRARLREVDETSGPGPRPPPAR
jgi:hypothetical protein